MKINCISCGHKVDVSDAYDDYEGQIKCFVCDSLLEINTSEGQLKSIRISEILQSPPDQPGKRIAY